MSFFETSASSPTIKFFEASEQINHKDTPPVCEAITILTDIKNGLNSFHPRDGRPEAIVLSQVPPEMGKFFPMAVICSLHLDDKALFRRGREFTREKLAREASSYVTYDEETKTLRIKPKLLNLKTIESALGILSAFQKKELEIRKPESYYSGMGLTIIDTGTLAELYKAQKELYSETKPFFLLPPKDGSTLGEGEKAYHVLYAHLMQAVSDYYGGRKIIPISSKEELDAALSEHGFTDAEKDVYLNVWAEQNTLKPTRDQAQKKAPKAAAPAPEAFIDSAARKPKPFDTSSYQSGLKNLDALTAQGKADPAALITHAVRELASKLDTRDDATLEKAGYNAEELAEAKKRCEMHRKIGDMLLSRENIFLTAHSVNIGTTFDSQSHTNTASISHNRELGNNATYLKNTPEAVTFLTEQAKKSPGLSLLLRTALHSTPAISNTGYVARMRKQDTSSSMQEIIDTYPELLTEEATATIESAIKGIDASGFVRGGSSTPARAARK